MKNLTFFLILLFSCLNVQAQSDAKDADRTYSTYYHQRASLFEVLPATSKDILFLGNSITDGSEWCELFNNRRVKNRGISGDVTWGVYDRLDTIVKGKPAKIFLLIGINDIGRGKSDDYVLQGIERIVKKIKAESPRTELYVQSILPVNPGYEKFKNHVMHWQRIPGLNERIRQMADKEGVKFIDIFSHLANEKGQLNDDYTNDGLHLLGKGYLVWKEVLLPYVKK